MLDCFEQVCYLLQRVLTVVSRRLEFTIDVPHKFLQDFSRFFLTAKSFDKLLQVWHAYCLGLVEVSGGQRLHISAEVVQKGSGMMQALFAFAVLWNVGLVSLSRVVI
jgi:hypothetical protein